LKALSVSSNHKRRARAVLTIIISCLTIIIMAANVFWSWAAPAKNGGFWLALFDEHDMAVLAAQLLIGCVMLGFHVLYELVYWRETQCVMPWDSEQNRPWDPREKHGHGLLFSHRWFGLPSMWFTSRGAYDDLRLWVTLAHSKSESSHIATKIFPEEMALYALDPHNASDLQKTLKSAKLFSRAEWEFLVRDASLAEHAAASRPQGSASSSGTAYHLPQVQYRSVAPYQQPEELQIELALFDSRSGQYLEPCHHAEYRSSVMQLIKTPVAPQAAVDPWNSPGTSLVFFPEDTFDNEFPEAFSPEACVQSMFA